VEFVVEKMAVGQLFTDYFHFPCQFSFYRLFHTHRHLSFGVSAVVDSVSHHIKKLKQIDWEFFVVFLCGARQMAG
jgi:hypothetical protein